MNCDIERDRRKSRTESVQTKYTLVYCTPSKTVFIVWNIRFQGVKAIKFPTGYTAHGEIFFPFFLFYRLYSKLLAAACAFKPQPETNLVVQSLTARTRTIKTCSHSAESLKFTTRTLRVNTQMTLPPVIVYTVLNNRRWIKTFRARLRKIKNANCQYAIYCPNINIST